MNAAQKSASQPKRDVRPLPLDLDLDLAASGRLARAFLAGLMAFTTVSITALAVAPMRELAAAPGEIKPVGEITALHHVEGGKVAQLPARVGERVSAGQVLMRLRPMNAAQDLAQLEIRLGRLSLQRERLAALLQGRTPDFPRLWPRFDDASRPPFEAMNTERRLHHAEAEAFKMELGAYEARLEQRKRETTARLREAQAVAKEVASRAEQARMAGELARRNIGSRREYLSLHADLAEVQAREEALRAQAAAASAGEKEAAAEMAKFTSVRKAEWAERYSQIDAEIAELERTVAKHVDRLNELTLRAPFDAVVHELGVQTVGGVLQPGALAAKLVPVRQDILAEVRISPDDIGHIEIGSPAIVRVSTFDAARVGEINGVVRTLSPAAYASPEGERYFLAELVLDRDHVFVRGHEHPLSPGMTVHASIKTGAKTVLEYLFKPVSRGFESAFTER